MYRKNLTLSALKKQCELIEDLVSRMEASLKLSESDRTACAYQIKGIVSNLKAIRKIQKNYQQYSKKNRVSGDKFPGLFTYLIDR